MPHWLPPSLVRRPPPLPPVDWPQPSTEVHGLLDGIPEYLRQQEEQSALRGGILPNPPKEQPTLGTEYSLLGDIPKLLGREPRRPQWREPRAMTLEYVPQPGDPLIVPPVYRPDQDPAQLVLTGEFAPDALMPAALGATRGPLSNPVAGVSPSYPVQWPGVPDPQVPAMPPSPPVEHLDSAKYWGAAPIAPNVNDQLPGFGTYVAPVPPAPDWGLLPRPASSPSQEIPPSPPVEHLDSAQYWGVAPLTSSTNDQPPGFGTYVTPVPPSPDWESVPTNGNDKGAGTEIGPVTALLTGIAHGANANLGDKVAGVIAAGGANTPAGAIRNALPIGAAITALIGLARLGYEQQTGEGEVTRAYEQGRDAFQQQLNTAREQYPGTTRAGNALGASLPTTRALQLPNGTGGAGAMGKFSDLAGDRRRAKSAGWPSATGPSSD